MDKEDARLLEGAIGFIVGDHAGREVLEMAMEKLKFSADWIADPGLKAVAAAIIENYSKGKPWGYAALVKSPDRDMKDALEKALCAADKLYPAAALYFLATVEMHRREAGLVTLLGKCRNDLHGNYDIETVIANLLEGVPGFSRPENALADAGISLIDWRRWLENPPAPFEWIVKDFIGTHFKGDLNGKSKQRKSFFAQQLAHCVACGLPFLGMGVPKPRRVAYFDLEMPERAIYERGKAMDEALGATPAEGFLFECALRRNPAALRANVAALKSLLAKRGIELAIIDPRYLLFADGEDECTSAGIRGVLEFRDALLDVCAVLYVGHDPKGSVEGKGMADRGSGSWTGSANYDFGLALSPHETDGYTVLTAQGRCRQTPGSLTIAFNAQKGIFEAAPGIEPQVKTTAKKA